MLLCTYKLIRYGGFSHVWDIRWMINNVHHNRHTLKELYIKNHGFQLKVSIHTLH